MKTVSLKWVWRCSALAVLLLGWMFIVIINNGHLTPSVVYVMLAYLAGVGAIYALFRMGASAVGDVEPDDPEAWGLPQTARDDLEREKRTLLKAIKEAELDHQMGKLTKRDLDEMVRTYRLRAIDVIKLLEDTGSGSARDEIQREVRARLEVEAIHAKVEKAHAGLTKRRNPKKAAAAAQAAARAAAAAGASPEAARAAAAQAAVETDLDADDHVDDDKSTAKSDGNAAKAGKAKSDDKPAKTDDTATDGRADDTAAKAAKADDKATAKSDGKAAAKADKAAAKTNDNANAESDDTAAKADEKAAKADDKSDDKAVANADDKAAAKADDKAAAKSDDKAAAKADDKAAAKAENKSDDRAAAKTAPADDNAKPDSGARSDAAADDNKALAETVMQTDSKDKANKEATS